MTRAVRLSKHERRCLCTASKSLPVLVAFCFGGVLSILVTLCFGGVLFVLVALYFGGVLSGKDRRSVRTA